MFHKGFSKISADQQQQQGFNWKPLAAGAGAAALTYGALRSGAKTNLSKVVEYKAPTSAFMRAFDRVRFGADEVLYYGGKSVPKKPAKVKGTVLHTQAGDRRYFSGDKNIGDVSFKKERGLEDKYLEDKMLKRYEKNRPKADIGSRVKLKNVKDLDKVLKRMPSGFVIKDRKGFGSGVGGIGFVDDEDLADYFLGKELTPGKEDLITSFLKGKKDKYLVQQKMKILEDSATGANREMRVHAIGGKVIPNATAIRAMNETDKKNYRRAEKYVQRFLDRLPKHLKKDNLTWAPDVAFTDKGMKIIETNRGAMSSGLLDPKYLAKGGEYSAAIDAGRMNQHVYKHVTGRDTPLYAAGKGLAAGTLAGGGTLAYQKIKEKRDKKKSK